MCAETLAMCSNEESPGGRGQKGPGRRGGARRYEQQHSMVPLGFVLCGEVNSTLESSYGWSVSDPLISVRAELTLESCFSSMLFKSLSPPLRQVLFTDLLGHNSL